MTVTARTHAAGPLPGAGFALGYGSNGFADHTLQDMLEVLEANGYGALALTLGHPHLDPFADDALDQAAALRGRLDKLGWRVVVETGSRYLLDPFTKHRPTLVDPEARPRLRFLHRAIDIAAVLRADCVSLWSGVLPSGVSAEAGWTMLCERMAGVVDYAEAAGVMLGFEPEPGMLVETVADALRLREELGNPAALGITIDLGHCVAVEPGSVADTVRAAGKLLVNVQVDDMMPGVHEHLELGHGLLDLSAALDALAGIDYRGVAAIELPRHSHDAPGLAARSMGELHRAWEAR